MAFIKGTSGNVKGRKPGIPDRRTEFRELLKPHAPALLAKVVEMALGGDSGAMKLCLDRITPAIKPTSEPVSVQLPAGSLADQSRSILEQAACGNITLEDGVQLMNIINQQVKVIELTEIIERIERIEATSTKEVRK